MKNKCSILSVVVALAGFLPQSKADLIDVALGTANNFAVLGGSAITVAGAVNSTKITGDIGSYPTQTITGLDNVVLTGVNQTGDAGLMLTAKNDLTTAFNNANGRLPTTSYGLIYDFNNATLAPGVYHGESSLEITGTLTLDAGGDPNAVWIFQATDSTLLADSHSQVILKGGAQACHVFWVVGSSATLGTYSDFVGNILAKTSITANIGATVDGRLLAETGAVTLENNTITVPTCVPEPGTLISGALLLLPFGSSALRFLRRNRTA